MATGLERDIEGRALGAQPCLLEGKNFCVGLSGTLVIALPDNAAVLDHKGTDHGIRAGLAQALRRETKRQGHEVEMRGGSSHRSLRVTRDRLRGADFGLVILAAFVFDFVAAFAVFFAFARAPDCLRAGAALVDPSSAKAAWAAASLAMATR